MKRIVIPLAFVGAIVVLLGVSVFWFVYSMQRTIVLPSVKPAEAKPAPLTYDDMEKLEGKGEQAVGQIPRLLACFETDDEDVRIKASETFKEIGVKAVGPVAGMLTHKDAKVRFYALHTLALIGPDAVTAVEGVRACLQDADSEVRYKAAYALGRLGWCSEPVIDSLSKLIVDGDDNVANHALEALEKLGPPAAKMLYPMLAIKTDPRRERVLALLVKLGTPSRDAVPTLAELAKEPSSQSIRGNALRLLGRLGTDALPALKDALKKADPNDDLDLMPAIAALGPNAKELLPELSSYLANRVFWDAEQEAMTPFKASGADGAKALAGLLKTMQAKLGNPLDHREMAVLRTLGAMGSDAKVAVPTLARIIHQGT